jgi:hypothetical protein
MRVFWQDIFSEEASASTKWDEEALMRVKMELASVENSGEEGMPPLELSASRVFRALCRSFVQDFCV